MNISSRARPRHSDKLLLIIFPRLHIHHLQPHRKRNFVIYTSQSTQPTDKMTQSKADKIEETKANLPLPEQPPVASDFNSADASTVNVGSGRTQTDVSTGPGSEAGLKGPATQPSEMDMSSIGRQGVEGLAHPPKDAASKN